MSPHELEKRRLGRDSVTQMLHELKQRRLMHELNAAAIVPVSEQAQGSSSKSSNQETPTPASHETPKDAPKLKEAPLSISDEARMARTKRKLHDAYVKAWAIKKQRTIKVIDVLDGEYDYPA